MCLTTLMIYRFKCLMQQVFLMRIKQIISNSGWKPKERVTQRSCWDLVAKLGESVILLFYYNNYYELS